MGTNREVIMGLQYEARQHLNGLLKLENLSEDEVNFIEYCSKQEVLSGEDCAEIFDIYERRA